MAAVVEVSTPVEPVPYVEDAALLLMLVAPVSVTEVPELAGPVVVPVVVVRLVHFVLVDVRSVDDSVLTVP